MLYLRIILLFTLRTLLNAIICCLQLNTQSLLGWYSEGGLLVIDAVGWRSMYHVVMPKTNIIVVIMSCTCIVMHSLFVNCPAVICSPSMLFICYGETPLVNCGPRSFFFYIDNTTHNNNCFLAPLQFPFSFIYCKHQFPHYTFNPLFSARPVRLTTSLYRWGKVAWLCCVQDSTLLLTPVVRPAKSQLATTFRSDFFLLLVD